MSGDAVIEMNLFGADNDSISQVSQLIAKLRTAQNSLVAPQRQIQPIPAVVKVFLGLLLALGLIAAGAAINEAQEGDSPVRESSISACCFIFELLALKVFERMLTTQQMGYTLTPSAITEIRELCGRLDEFAEDCSNDNAGDIKRLSSIINATLEPSENVSSDVRAKRVYDFLNEAVNTLDDCLPVPRASMQP